MTTHLVTSEYNGLNITFTDDGWFNATIAAERFGKRPIDWLNLDSTKEYINVLCDVSNCQESSLLKTRRGRHNSGTWLHPELSVTFARWLDVRFSIWCDKQIRQILTGSHPHYDWQRVRHEATSSFKVMNAVLQLQMKSQGKIAEPKHFTTEIRLVNWALTGVFHKLDRESLNKDELSLLAKIESHNAVLIGSGLDYVARKQTLKDFADELRGFSIQEQAA